MYKSICGNFLLCLKGKYNGSQISRNIKSIEYASISFGLPCGSVGKEFTCNGETWVQSLGWEDPLEKGTAAYSSILAWNPIDCIVHGVAKSRTQQSDFHFLSVYSGHKQSINKKK